MKDEIDKLVAPLLSTRKNMGVAVGVPVSLTHVSP